MDKSKSLQELEGYDAGDPKTKTTPMVRRCLTLHRTPLEQWSAEDCRLMLGQKISPQLLVPLAIEFLQINPLEGMVPGSLLDFVLRLPEEFWRENPEYWWMLQETLLEVEMLREEIERLLPAIDNFKTIEIN